MAENFQVDLRAIIQLLSNNLYSGPQVFIRELIQNGVDAIRARQQLTPGFQGKIEMELSDTPGQGRLLMFEDNGIGLTESEVRQFLATIGSSSKRESLLERKGDFIGQFGIGLLSCFIVTDEIVLLTQSAKSGTPPVEWRGRSDGSYTLRTIESKVSVGTKLYFRVATGKEEFFQYAFVAQRARNYASLLPIPITLREGERNDGLNLVAPWKQSFRDEQERQESYAEFGRTLFGSDFFDALPLLDEAAGFEGAAYILPHVVNPASRKVHRLYLKEMLISDEIDSLVPEWAFFIKCVVTARALTPTASRESVCENEELEAVRESIGRQLKRYIQQLVKFDSARLQRFLALHERAIKHLATFDDEILRLFIEHLPFETNFGLQSLADCRRQSDEVFYVSDVDEFRQLAEIARAQGTLVLNAGYVYETEILENYATLVPEKAVCKLSLTSFTEQLGELDLKQREQFFDLLEKARAILQRFQVQPEIRRFQPESLAALFIASRQILFRRSVEEVKEIATPEWGGILDNIFTADETEVLPELCLNAANPLVQQLARQARTRSARDLKEVVEVLYVQTLLSGRRVVRPDESKALNEGILRLVQAHLNSL